MLKKLFIFCQYIVPQHALSRVIGFFANCRTKWFKNLLIGWFIKHYGVDMSLAKELDYKKYATFNKFFTRELDLSKRDIQAGGSSIISPVDGVISQFGRIENDQLMQAKGASYSLDKLLGGEGGKQYANGEFITIYLSPRDYHRVHMPLSGKLLSMKYIPGKLFSVNAATTEAVDGLFTKNERIVCEFQTVIGNVAVIMVGAMLVASIHTAWAGKVAPNQSTDIQHFSYQQDDLILKQTEEMGYFELGSTVILLFPENTIKWIDKLALNSSILMGALVARISNFL